MSCLDHGDGPCMVPPHPDLVAKLAAERVAAASSEPEQGRAAAAGAPSGTTSGINEGIIKPPSAVEGPAGKTLAQRSALNRAPLRGTIRAVVVLVDFPDKAMSAGAAQRFRDLFFSKGVVASGSATEYYSDVSNGKISLDGQVLGPYRMPKKLSEYAHGNYGYGGTAPNVQTLAWDAVSAADPNINFNAYDNDGNGYVDAFIVVHAGTGAEQSGNKNDLWSLQWSLTSERKVDKTKIYGFLTIPEDANVGVCCHELGHLLFGWPDLYDADYSSKGVGSWCLMSGGSWGGFPAGTRPVHPSAWCKVNQGWVDVDNEYGPRTVTFQDVKAGKRVSRIWSGGRTEQEYFLVENRQQSGFDQSLPSSGLLVWHIDDNQRTNTDENHYKVALMQADGANNLGTNTNSGDRGDPFPGSSNNTKFDVSSNPNSRAYTGRDTEVSITDISASGPNMTAKIRTYKPGFRPAYTMGSPGSGIGGYDLADPRDNVIAYDYDSTGRMQNLVLWRPGTGTIYILANNGDGGYSARFAATNGVGGYDLLDNNDQIIAFDFNSSGKNDHLICYRPGSGACYILRKKGLDFECVYSSLSGIGGFDLAESWDRMFAYDYNGSGKLDHLCLYRPNGTAWVVRNSGGNFQAVYASGSGIGGFDFKNPLDKAFALDWNKSGKMDHIMCYRPGQGIVWCVRRGGSSGFEPVMISSGTGIGGYNLVSPDDRAFACDYSGRGRMDQVAFYRPGTGTLWILEKNSANEWGAIWADGDPGYGFGGYDLASRDDRIFAFDHEMSGLNNHLVVYRKDGSGTIWIQKCGS